jgi:ABC-type transport system substrate-binding protein
VRLHPAGTGRFTLARWDQNQVIVLERNAHYFKPGLPYLDRIELRIMKEGVTRVTALRAGEVDFANAVPREHVKRLAKDPQIPMLRAKDTQSLNLTSAWLDAFAIARLIDTRAGTNTIDHQDTQVDARLRQPRRRPMAGSVRRS